jgi:hypothetical protein
MWVRTLHDSIVFHQTVLQKQAQSAEAAAAASSVAASNDSPDSDVSDFKDLPTEYHQPLPALTRVMQPQERSVAQPPSEENELDVAHPTLPGVFVRRWVVLRDGVMQLMALNEVCSVCVCVISLLCV